MIGHGGRVYGQLDVDCDTSDRAAFKAVADILPKGAVWLTSTLKRTRLTAAALIAAGELGDPKIEVEHDLIEQSFGDWQETLNWDEIHAAKDGIAMAFWDDPANNSPPGGESFADHMARVGAVIGRLTEKYSGRDIIAVSHGGTIRAAIGLAINVSAEHAIRFHITNLSLTRLDHFEDYPTNAWRVTGVNAPPGMVPTRESIP